MFNLSIHEIYESCLIISVFVSLICVLWTVVEIRKQSIVIDKRVEENSFISKALVDAERVNYMVLTLEEIRDLAKFAGLRVEDDYDDDEILYLEFAIADCPEAGIDGHFWPHIVYMPYDETVKAGLGPQIDEKIVHPEKFE